MSPPPKLSRRSLTIGGIAAGGAAIIAGVVYEAPKLFKRRPHGEYAELVSKLSDPEKAAVVGRAIHLGKDRIEGDISLDGRTFEEIAAQDLKARLAKHNVAELMAIDSSKISGVVEAGGWVIPVTLAELCTLAAQSV